MGSDDGFENEIPVHIVEIASFQITQTEITVSQYRKCENSGSCVMESSTNILCNANPPGYENHPLNCVDYNEAVDFCGWSGGRLPSEAQWEYAARSGGQKIAYPWGNEMPSCEYAVMDDEGNGCGSGRTMEVCSKTKGNTEQNLCDMTGNVWERTLSLWGKDWERSDFEYPYDLQDGRENLEADDDIRRVVRGGAFSSLLVPRCACRSGPYSKNLENDIGFRVCVAAQQE